jgi:cobalamin (vitamin B12) biosynthesis cbiG protein
MKTAIVSLTRNGREISLKIAEILGDDNKCIRYAFEKYTDYDAITFTNLKETVKEIFAEFNAIIFVCACGIAVRVIAPYIVSKFSDPAVVVVDEQGRYAVSLISGHIGGANALAEKIAHIINAIPVITTATDVGGRFSPDSFAVSNNLHICEPELAKIIAAMIVDSKKIGLYCDYDYVNLPREYFCDNSKTGICISRDFAKNPFVETLHLVPKNIVIGVGCRKNTPPQMLENFILKNLAANNIEVFQLSKICSINIKRNEKAINEFSSKYRVPAVFFSSEQLMKAKGEFSASEFVMKTTGADNVCERSAVCGGGKIIVRKIAENGMTFAAAEEENLMIDFGRRVL